MRIPPSHVAAGSATVPPNLTLHNDRFWMLQDNGGFSENWSSLIGIVTAIVGNVLISFALNIQRYAHTRLDREVQEKERQQRSRHASSASLAKLASNSKNRSHGRTAPSWQREAMNGHARSSENAGRGPSESDPLIHKDDSRPRLRRSESDDLQEETFKHKSYLKSPYWWLGIILMTVGEAGNFLAYGFAPASIVSPLGVVALISNCIIAPVMLKEPFRKRDMLGVIIAVGGAVTVVLSADDNNPKLGPDEIWNLITRWEFETYLGITIAVIAGLIVLSNRFGEKNILIDLGLVGLFGGYTALSTKGVSSLLSYTLWHAITFPVFYLLLLILIGTAVMQIKYVNRALQRFDATQVIPVQFVLFTLSVIGGSAILYRDFERTSGEDAAKFVGGCALTFSGVYLITSGRPSRHDEDEEDREPESEEAINLGGDRYCDDPDEAHDPTMRNIHRPSTVRTTSSTVNTYQPYCDDPEAYPSTPKTSLPTRSTTIPDAADAVSPLLHKPLHQQTASNSIDSPLFARHNSTPILPSEPAPPSSLISASDPELLCSHPPLPVTPARGRTCEDVMATPTAAQSHLRRIRTADRNPPHRHSLQGSLLQASPFSNTLSTVVQDIMRKEPEAWQRRSASVLRTGAVDEASTGTLAPNSFGGSLDRRQRRSGGGSVTRDGEAAATPSASEEGKTRGRSLSGTLGELWRGIRGEGGEADRTSTISHWRVAREAVPEIEQEEDHREQA